MFPAEIFIILLAVFLVVAFAVLINPPNALVNLLHGKKEDKSE